MVSNRYRALFVLPIVLSTGLVVAQAPASVPQHPAPQPSQTQTAEPPSPSPQATPNSSSSGAPPASTNKDADYSTQQAVVKKHDTVYRFENDGTGTRTETAFVLVQSEAGVQQLGQLQLGYNSGNQDIKLNYVRVRKPDGSVINTDLTTSVQDITGPVARVAPMYTDYREKHVTVPALRPGDTLEYQTVIVTTKPLAENQFWMEHNFDDQLIVLDETLTVDVPKARKVYLKTDDDAKTYSDQVEGDRRIYKWTYKNSKTRMAKYEEEREKTGKYKKRPTDELPSVQMTTFQNWDELAKWYGGLEHDRRIPNDAMKAKVAELTKDKKTDREKIQAVYDYVAKNYRYVSLSLGIGRYQPHASTEVFSNEYGDCKDKHTLLASMVSVLGYKMNTVLIGSQHKLDVEVASPSQFDHVIGNLKLGNDTIWMDTTSEIAPIGMLVAPIRDKQALQISPEAKSTIVKTPATPPFMAYTKFDMDGKVSALGKLEARVTREMRGDAELAMRSAFRRVPESNWTQLVNYIANEEQAGAKASNVKVENLNDTSKPMVLSYDIALSNFLDYTAKDAKFYVPLESYKVPDLDADDPEPAKFYGPVTMSAHVKIVMPDSVTVEPPVPVEIKRDYATYTASSEFKDHVLTADRKIVVNVQEIPQMRAGDLKAFGRVIASDVGQQARATNTAAGTESAPKLAKTEELEEAAYNALQARKFKLAADLYTQVTEKDAKHPRAWNNLGRSYMAMMQLDKAVAAFKKALEVNAYDEFAYNNLGSAYELQQNFNDAKDAYRKQIEINPLDEFAHSNLGRLLLRDGQNAEAVKELERAHGIKPDDALASQQLGEAYLNTGQTEKAMSTFDKALENSPTPMMWNNVAYVLAKSKTNLDKALEYAQSAVSTTETQLKNVSPEQIEWQGRAISASLGSYWDTLGWVYFAQGDMKNSEKYLLAAWQHSQHGEVADHLAQLYEKQGDKQKAIDYYALAMAAPEGVPDTRKRLETLVGAKQATELAAKKKKELASMRTMKLDWPQQEGNADVLLTFGRSGGVEQVKFLSGEKEFSPKSGEFKALKLPMAFPDQTTQGFVHKASVSCTKASGCSMTIQPADARIMGAEGVETEE
jgi:tetratricopeptide (TPR) repeat protein/transglutaminase-like putative cysteine protease